ncbi:MAG: hypothetical protein QOG64_392 [Acidimicrobiaceae bacterium]|nr:hypothetical protein [Acidimicrobiaceae bacterium]
MTIVLLVVMVVAAVVLVRGQQNQPDLRGMNDHDRAMAALHKLAEPGLPGPSGPRTTAGAGAVGAGAVAATGWSGPSPRSLWPRWRRPAIALAVLVGVGAVVTTRLIGGSDRPVVHTAARPAPSAAPVDRASAPTPGGPSGAPAAPPAPPATALQPVAEQTTALAPAAVDGRGATYLVTHAPFTLVLTAGGPCWAEVRDANRQVLYRGTLAPGEVQTFTGTDLSLRMGAIGNVTIQVDGASLVFPVHDPVAYNVRVARAG